MLIANLKFMEIQTHFTLLEVLRQERDRLKNKTIHKDNLQSNYLTQQNLLTLKNANLKNTLKKITNDKIKKAEQIRDDIEFIKRKKNNLQKQANECLSCFHKKMKQIRHFREKIKEMENKNQFIYERQLQAEEKMREEEDRLSVEIEECAKMEYQSEEYFGQCQIGKMRISKLEQQLNQALIDINEQMQGTRAIKNSIMILKSKNEDLQNMKQIYNNKKTQTIKNSSQICEQIRKTHNQKFVQKKTIQTLQKELKHAKMKETEENKELRTVENRLKIQRQKCEQIESKIVVVKSEVGIMNRNNRMLEKRIDEVEELKYTLESVGKTIQMHEKQFFMIGDV